MTVRACFLFEGVVQGVGFRPFVFRVATGMGLAGSVRNRSDGVVVEVEGAREGVDAFAARVMDDPPPAADVVRATRTDVAPRGEQSFRILPSDPDGQRAVHIAPDIATCDACLAELFTPADRRFRYPFINCTNCGPRLTIIRGIPYDRPKTSMDIFPLCRACRDEYEDPADRRFHAEPNACMACGPKLSLLDNRGAPMAASDPIARALEALSKGEILALKGLGGFHLAVDAANHGAVERLRERKCREAKPLAVMVRDVRRAAEIAEIGREEERLLLSPQRPIVLAAKREGGEPGLSTAVAPGMVDLGIMLPYTPLHQLLLAGPLSALVMTSANRTDEPICTRNDEALERLSGIADLFLVHDREILVRCDDSVATVVAGSRTMFRRSRGYAPKSLVLEDSYPDVLALGAHKKATLCVLTGNLAFLSPHIGDMETPQARDFFHETVALMQRIAGCMPERVACDLHPEYYSSRIAAAMEGVEVVRVQHHHAHVVSCMAENGLAGEVIGLAMDGTGYGEDGQVWGGEFLVADRAGFVRAGHLGNFPLPGGEAAIREPWRVAASLLREAYGGGWRAAASRLGLGPEPSTLELLGRIMEKGINCPLTSSLGRVFDGVAAILGLRSKVSFEGQAAMELEALAGRSSDLDLPFEVVAASDGLVLEFSPMIRAIVEARLAGRSREDIASAFHRVLPEAFTAMAEALRARTGLARVVLSGGCFQNRILLVGSVEALERSGFEVYTHCDVPPNDGGIALGQAVVAGAQEEGDVRKAEPVNGKPGTENRE